MRNVYRVVFAVSFKSHSDRDAFQATINARLPALVSGLSLKTRVTPADGGEMLTNEATETGYEWFDNATKDAVWASRMAVGFESETERNAFFDALVNEFKDKIPVFTYYVDKSGKVGAFNKDTFMLRELSDLIQVDLK